MENGLEYDLLTIEILQASIDVPVSSIPSFRFLFFYNESQQSAYNSLCSRLPPALLRPLHHLPPTEAAIPAHLPLKRSLSFHSDVQVIGVVP